jgi:hypothetical protein
VKTVIPLPIVRISAEETRGTSPVNTPQLTIPFAEVFMETYTSLSDATVFIGRNIDGNGEKATSENFIAITFTKFCETGHPACNMHGDSTYGLQVQVEELPWDNLHGSEQFKQYDTTSESHLANFRTAEEFRSVQETSREEVMEVSKMSKIRSIAAVSSHVKSEYSLLLSNATAKNNSSTFAEYL